MTPVRLRLAQLRTKAGLSQNQLAKLSGVPQSTISRLEGEIHKGVDFAVLERLADALKVHASTLIEHKPRRR
jgi:transcriptional regulator with XRE-family HTH domain